MKKVRIGIVLQGIIILFVISSFFSFYHFYRRYNNNKDNYVERLKNESSFILKYLEKRVNEAVNDIKILASDLETTFNLLNLTPAQKLESLLREQNNENKHDDITADHDFSNHPSLLPVAALHVGHVVVPIFVLTYRAGIIIPVLAVMGAVGVIRHHYPPAISRQHPS